VRRLVLVVALLCVASCRGGSSTPTEPSGCVGIAGTYNAVWSNSCGDSGNGVVVVAQSGCSFGAVFPGLGTLSGTIDGPLGIFVLAFASPCSGSASGSATLAGAMINGAYSGAATGQGCCNPVSGSFTLTR